MAAVPVDVEVTYRPDPAGMAAVGLMPGMRAMTTDTATRYAALARSLTPSTTGRVRRAIRVMVPGQDRRGVFTGVRASWSFWHFVEFGTINNRPAAPFRRAADQLGIRFTDPGRGGGS
jgi:hypothetical protein